MEKKSSHYNLSVTPIRLFPSTGLLGGILYNYQPVLAIFLLCLALVNSLLSILTVRKVGKSRVKLSIIIYIIIELIFQISVGLLVSLFLLEIFPVISIVLACIIVIISPWLLGQMVNREIRKSLAITEIT